MTEEDLEALEDLAVGPKTWVDLAVLQVVGKDLVAEHLEAGLNFHRKLADEAAAHLNLLGDNTYRTPWLAAKLLSKDQALAKASAASLVKHLVTTRPGNRTSFEAHLLSTEDLWKALEEFSKAEPACLLWHGQGQYEALFRFLATRFLLAPDHVLDTERIHARWQWDCVNKRGLRLPAMNASLRLVHYLEHNQQFPTHEELFKNLEAEALEHKLALEGLDDDVALGWRCMQASADPKPIAKPQRQAGRQARQAGEACR